MTMMMMLMLMMNVCQGELGSPCCGVNVGAHCLDGRPRGVSLSRVEDDVITAENHQNWKTECDCFDCCGVDFVSPAAYVDQPLLCAYRHF